MDHSIKYWLFLYLYYVLLPVLPAIIIYKHFPDTTVRINGLFNGVKLNVVAAFGAYLISTLLGLFIIKVAFTIIKETSVKTLTMAPKAKFADANFQPAVFKITGLSETSDTRCNDNKLIPAFISPYILTGEKDAERKIEAGTLYLKKDRKQYKHSSDPSFGRRWLLVKNAQ